MGHTRPEEDRPPACPQGCHPRPAGRGRTVWHRGDNSEEGAREGEGRGAGEGNGEQEYGGFVKCRLARWFLTPRGSLNLERSAAFRSPDRSTSGDSGPLAAFNLERPRWGRRASTRREPTIQRIDARRMKTSMAGKRRPTKSTRASRGGRTRRRRRHSKDRASFILPALRTQIFEIRQDQVSYRTRPIHDTTPDIT